MVRALNASPIGIGRIGEEYTARYLKKQRFKIKETNMRNSLSEIDIIAENKTYILFVEVKTRTKVIVIFDRLMR